jgi:hypothetical protein
VAIFLQIVPLETWIGHSGPLKLFLSSQVGKCLLTGVNVGPMQGRFSTDLVLSALKLSGFSVISPEENSLEGSIL